MVCSCFCTRLGFKIHRKCTLMGSFSFFFFFSSCYALSPTHPIPFTYFSAKKGKCEILPSWSFSNYTYQMSLDGEISPWGPTSLQKISSLSLSTIWFPHNFQIISHWFQYALADPVVLLSSLFSHPQKTHSHLPDFFIQFFLESLSTSLPLFCLNISTLILSILPVLEALC